MKRPAATLREAGRGREARRRHLPAEASAEAGRRLTLRNWLVGGCVHQYELNGAEGASYGERLLTALADRLSDAKVSNCRRRQLYRYLRFTGCTPRLWGRCPHHSRASCHPGSARTEKWGRRPHFSDGIRTSSCVASGAAISSSSPTSITTFSASREQIQQFLEVRLKGGG